jgi:hypothetical protein
MTEKRMDYLAKIVKIRLSFRSKWELFTLMTRMDWGVYRKIYGNWAYLKLTIERFLDLFKKDEGTAALFG